MTATASTTVCTRCWSSSRDAARPTHTGRHCVTSSWGELLPMVHHIASRYRNRGEPAADLEQVGTIGLMLALDRFDPDRGHAFLSFAVPTITGEIRRHFRDRTWFMRVPRALKDLQGPVRDAVTTLSTKLGRGPRPTEIAAHLDVTTDLVIEALHAAHAHTAPVRR